VLRDYLQFRISSFEFTISSPPRCSVRFVSRDKFRVPLAEFFVVDPPASRHVVVGEGNRIEIHLVAEALVPDEAMIRDIEQSIGGRPSAALELS